MLLKLVIGNIRIIQAHFNVNFPYTSGLIALENLNKDLFRTKFTSGHVREY